MDWIRGCTIGRGSSATVSTASSRWSDGVFAVKSVELSRSECLQREQKILSTLNCHHIVGYRGYDITTENGKTMFNLKMDYASQGTLTDAVRRGGRFNESRTGYHTCRIVQGLEYLHSKGIVHCDIKGSNILLAQDGNAKIADFGCAKAADADEAAIMGGTPMFMSPEVVRGEEQWYPADIWALGCTIIEMSTGRSPWPNATISTLRHIAFSGESPEIPPFLSDKAKDFLSKCLRVDPRERWTAEQLLKHPFLEEFRVVDHVDKVVRELLMIKSDDHTESPTSILDHNVWSLTEGVYLYSEGSNQQTQEDFLKSPPRQRIEQLALSNCGRIESRLVSDDWITVRDNYKKLRVG